MCLCLSLNRKRDCDCDRRLTLLETGGGLLAAQSSRLGRARLCCPAQRTRLTVMFLV
jgi:hypothetical protein